MKIRPRQQLLEVWRSLLAASWSDGRWRWADPTGNDSVVDAQQLLCLVFPPVDIESLRFSNPDATYEDVLSALQPLGGAIQIPRVVLDIQIQYLERHRDDEGPRFDGAGYLVLSDGATVTPETADRDIAEGFALSVTLTLAMLAFAREFRRVVNRGEVLDSLVSQARAMLDEAEHLYDQELLRRGVQVAPAIREMLDSVQGQLNRVREIIQVRPASAMALLTLALHELDSQDSARAGGEE